MAAITDKFTNASNGTRPAPTTLNAIKTIGASSISCSALTGWPTATAVHFIIYNVTTSGAKVAGSQTDWKGIVSGTTITSLTLKAGTDNGYGIGAIVEAGPTAAWADDMTAGAMAEHTVVGVHNAAAATTIASLLPTGSVAGTALAANAVTADKLATSAITLGYAQITTNYATVTTTSSDVTGLSVTVTVPTGGRRIRITAHMSLNGSGSVTGGGSMATTLWEGATQLDSQQVVLSNNSLNFGINNVSIVTPTVGTHTYKVQAQVTSGTGTGAVIGATNAPAFILVEAI